MDKWQSIETAPRDGTPILVYSHGAAEMEMLPRGMVVDSWQKQYQGFGKINQRWWPATHWQPLPAPPQED